MFRQLSRAASTGRKEDIFDFRSGDFLQINISKQKSDWHQYAYIPELEGDTENEKYKRRDIGEKIKEHFLEAQHEFFKPLKREIEIKDYFSRATYNHNSFQRSLPYLWKNEYVIVRQATTADQPKIARILPSINTLIKTSYKMANLRNLISRGLVIIATSYRNELKGIQALKTEKNILIIEPLLYIEADSRRKGSFSIICDMILNAAEYANYSFVAATCPSEHFIENKYISLGFKKKEKIVENKKEMLKFEKQISNKNIATFF